MEKRGSKQVTNGSLGYFDDKGVLHKFSVNNCQFISCNLKFTKTETYNNKKVGIFRKYNSVPTKFLRNNSKNKS